MIAHTVKRGATLSVSMDINNNQKGHKISRSSEDIKIRVSILRARTHMWP